MEKVKVLQARRILKRKEPKVDKSIEYVSAHQNFWFERNGQKYMFKLPVKDENFKFCLLNEVFISSLCEHLQINCQEASFAEYKLWNQEGVLIRSFLESGQNEINIDTMQRDFISSRLNEILGKNYFEKYIYPIIKQVNLKSKKQLTYTEKVINRFSIDEMKKNVNKKLEFLMHYFYQTGTASDISNCFGKKPFEEVRQNFIEIDYLNSIFLRNPTDKDLVKFANMYADKHNLLLEPNLVDQICAYAVFDYLTIQDDRNTHNISFIKDGNNLKLAPLFDNGMCFSCNFYKNQFDLCNNKWETNILLTDLTKSKLDDKNSLVYIIKSKMQDFLNNGYDEFVQEFLEKNPECVDFIYDNHLKNKDDAYKKEYINLYFENIKESIFCRLEKLEQNKNINFNKNNGILENEPLKIQKTQIEKSEFQERI